MINLNQLRAFYQAAKHLSFSEAANALYVTQPAVTAQVKAFETHCELKLFKKKAGKLYLTEEGKTIYKYALKVFDNEKDIEIAVEEMKKLKRGALRVGTARTYARYFMPFLISRFRQTYPKVKIHLDEGSSSEMVQSLVDLKNEIAIIAKGNENRKVTFIPFSQEELVLILSPKHKLARRRFIPFQQMAEEPIIMKEKGSGTRKLVDELFSMNNCDPNILMETSDAEMIKLLIQRGEGISFLVKESVARELKKKKLRTVPVKGHKLFLDVTIAYLRKQPLSPPAQAFLKSLKGVGTKEMRFKGMGVLMSKMLDQNK
ncbi:MAG: LysR family transcriptional regulator [Desulfobacteraceae bacterium]|jgi:DNA-binding transcriptional LysR family regulator